MAYFKSSMICSAAVLLCLLGNVELQAADRARGDANEIVRKAPIAVPRFDWSGFYLGGHVGYGRGTVVSDAAGASSTNAFGSLFGGLQAGYNIVLPPYWLLGIEGDVSFAHFYIDDQIVSRGTPASTISEQIDTIARLRGRLGLTLGNWLLYGAGGVSWSQARLVEEPGATSDGDKVLRTRSGWNVGAGAETAIASDWTARLEYLYDNLGRISADFPSGSRYESKFDLHTVRLGLNRKLGSADQRVTTTAAAEQWLIAPTDWNIHGQMTFIGQGYPAFRSPYEGANSLSGSRQAKETTSATAFVGLRLPTGTEFYINPELMQGSGLSDTFGLGGYSNGEAQKSGFPVPRLNIARVFVRHTFGLGGEQEVIEDGPNQLAGKQDISRITVAAGKFPVIDVFDGNAYSHDPRRDFLNWNMYCCGSYDLTMDKVGYTWGAYVELNQKMWAVRAGYFLVPTSSNQNSFDTQIPDRGEYIVEGELRYSLFSQPGKLRLIGWLNRAFAGSYAEAVALPLGSPGYPDIALTRRVRNNYGFVVNIEQALSSELGFFSRASWGAGHTEKIGWSDVDASLSAGTVLKGASWGRPNDRLGIGGLINWLSPEARAYFAAGGLGILIGDGALNYRPEQIVETFYAYSVNPALTLTLDYQFVVHPAYNADRGPVSIFGVRMHAEF